MQDGEQGLKMGHKGRAKKVREALYSENKCVCLRVCSFSSVFLSVSVSVLVSA